MVQHLLVGLFAVLRLVNAHQFHFGELVQTVQAAHVLAVGTGLAAEALRVGAVLDGELLLVQNHVAVDVRHGDFGGRNQVEVIHFAMVHLTLLVGQLARAVAGSGVHHGRRHNLRVARFACFVQEEVDEGALQLCAFALIDGEAGTGNLHAQVEVYQVILLGKFPVGQGIFGQFGFHAAHLLHYVVVGTHAFGHAVVGHVGDGVEQCLEVVGSLVHVGLHLLVRLFQFGDAALGGFRFLLLALLHQLSDGLGEGVGFRQVFI